MKNEKDEGVKNISLGALAPNEISFFERNLRKVTHQLDKIVFMLNSITHKFSKLILFLLMFLTTFDVLGRYLFNKPITGTYELTGLAIALMVFFSLGMTQITKDHISIDFLTNKFPVKVRAVLNCITYVFLLILLLLTTWEITQYTQRVWKGNQLSGDLGLPLYIFIILATIGILFFALAILLDIFKSLLKVVQKNES